MRASTHLRFGAALLTATLITACAGGNGGSLDAPPPSAMQAPREIALPEARVAGGDHQLSLILGARQGPGPGTVLPQLRVDVRYSGATRMYDTARDMHGRALRTERAGGDGCKAGSACAETVRIELPDTELRQAKASGYRLKLFARSGPEIEIGIPGAQITALYDRIDGVTARTASKKGS